jgi:hypothetical protein
MPLPDPISTERCRMSRGRSRLGLQAEASQRRQGPHCPICGCLDQEPTDDAASAAPNQSRPPRSRHFYADRKRGVATLYCRQDNIFGNLRMVSDAGTGHRA